MNKFRIKEILEATNCLIVNKYHYLDIVYQWEQIDNLLLN